jgi:nucleotide-binding universal stress UspA family protein
MAAGSSTEGSTKNIAVNQPPAPVQRVLVPLENSDFSRNLLPLLRGFFAPNEVELVLFGKSTAKNDLDAIAEELRTAGFCVQVVSDDDDAARSIVHYVHHAGIDMIAIPTLNRSGQEKSTGVSERVLRSVNVPVLLLRATT